MVVRQRFEALQSMTASDIYIYISIAAEDTDFLALAAMGGVRAAGGGFNGQLQRDWVKPSPISVWWLHVMFHLSPRNDCRCWGCQAPLSEMLNGSDSWRLSLNIFLFLIFAAAVFLFEWHARPIRRHLLTRIATQRHRLLWTRCATRHGGGHHEILWIGSCGGEKMCSRCLARNELFPRSVLKGDRAFLQ